MIQAKDAGTIKKFKETFEGNLSKATVTFACLRDEFYPKQDARTMADSGWLIRRCSRKLTGGGGEKAV